MECVVDGLLARTPDLLRSNTAGGSFPRTCMSMMEFRDSVMASSDLPIKDRAGFEKFFDDLEKRTGPPDRTIADAEVIRAFINEVNQDWCGLQARVWKRVRKLVTGGLRATGLERMPRRNEIRPSSEWAALLKLVQNDSDRFALRRFATWGTMHGIVPSGVCHDDFKSFIEDAAETLRSVAKEAHVRDHRRELFRELCKAWNRARARRPDRWPDVHVEYDLHRSSSTEPLNKYPARLQADIADMLSSRRQCDSDVLSPWRAPLAVPTSEQHVQGMIRRFLHDLCEARQLHPAALTNFKSLITAENLDAALTASLKRNRGRKAPTHYNLAVEIRNIAANLYGLSADELKPFDRLVSALKPKSTGRSDHSRGVFLQFTHTGFIDKVLSLGKDTLEKYQGGRVKSLCEARMEVRGALAVKLGIMLVLSLTALASMRIGADLVRINGGWQYRCATGLGCQRYDLVDLPSSVSRLIDLHLELQGITATAEDWLFPGDIYGRHLHVAVLSRHIARTLKACGQRITGGYLQDLATYLHLRSEPKDIGGAVDLRGHRTDRHIKYAFAFLFDRDVVEEFDAALVTGAHPLRGAAGGPA